MARDYVISALVSAEFAVLPFSTKLAPASSSADVVVIPDALAPIPLITPDIDTVGRAIEAGYGIDFCDQLIMAVAERATLAKIWSEDLD